MTIATDVLAPLRLPWMATAACRGLDPELFILERGQNAKMAAAFACCAGCSVRAECLEYGLSMPSDPGVYGGTTHRERMRIRRQRREDLS